MSGTLIIILLAGAMVIFGKIRDAITKPKSSMPDPGTGNIQTEADRERLRQEYQRRAEELRRRRAALMGQQPGGSPSQPSASMTPRAQTPVSPRASIPNSDPNRQRANDEAMVARKRAEEQRATAIARKAAIDRATAKAKANLKAAQMGNRGVKVPTPVRAPQTSTRPEDVVVQTPVQVTSTPTVASTPGKPAPVGSILAPGRGRGVILGSSLRQAVILKEILDPPVSMRESHLQ